MECFGNEPVQPDSIDVLVILAGNVLTSFCSLGIYRCLGTFNGGIKTEFHVNNYEISLVQGLFTGFMSFGAPAVVLVKWISYRKLGLISSALFTLSLLAASFSPNFAMYATLGGATAGLFGGTSINLLYLSIPRYYIKHRSLAAGYIYTVETIGVLLTTALYSRLTEEYDWHTGLFWMSIISAGGIVGAFVYRPVAVVNETPTQVEDVTETALGPEASADQQIATSQPDAQTYENEVIKAPIVQQEEFGNVIDSTVQSDERKSVVVQADSGESAGIQNTPDEATPQPDASTYENEVIKAPVVKQKEFGDVSDSTVQSDDENSVVVQADSGESAGIQNRPDQATPQLDALTYENEFIKAPVVQQEEVGDVIDSTVQSDETKSVVVQADSGESAGIQNRPDQMSLFNRFKARLKSVFDYTLCCQPIYILAFISSMLYWSAWAGIAYLMLPLGTNRLELETEDAVKLVMTLGAGELCGKSVSGFLCEWSGVNKAFLLAFTNVLAAIFTSAITFSQDHDTVLFLSFVLGLTYAPFGSQYVVLYADVFGSDKITHAMSIDGFVATLPTFLVTLILGALIDRTKDVVVSFHTCTGITAANAVCVLCIGLLQKGNTGVNVA